MRVLIGNAAANTIDHDFIEGSAPFSTTSVPVFRAGDHLRDVSKPALGSISRLGLGLILLAVGLSAQAIEHSSAVVPVAELEGRQRRNLWLAFAVLAVVFLVLAITTIQT